MLDFGKIIIYTSNLRIVRTPGRPTGEQHQRPVPPADLKGSPKPKERGSRRRSRSKDRGEKQLCDMEKEVMTLVLVSLRGAVETLPRSEHLCSSSLARKKPQDGERGHIAVI